MKKKLFIVCAALVWTAALMAQQIAVVTGSTTKMCQTLQDAIDKASNGSVIYLPGGGFQISDDVKIIKRVSIIGIGHKAVSENADGNTVISGNLYFNEGSDGSAVMGCYISGDVKIGYDEKSVNNILVKLCNLNSVQVKSNKCSGTIVNQNYIRNNSSFNAAPAEFTNNVAHSINQLFGGTINNNIIKGSSFIIYDCDNSTISNNVFLSRGTYGPLYLCSNYLASENMTNNGSCGDDPIYLEGVNWNDVFVNYNNGAISPASDFHFKGEYTQYSDCGIYGGSSFDPQAMPPVPYIVSKNIASQTDSSGMLSVKVRVKAGE